MKLLRESERNLRTVINELDFFRKTKKFDVENITYLPCEYKHGTYYPDLSLFKPFTKEMTWGDKRDSHAWFHFTVDIPDDMKGKEAVLSVYTNIDGWDAVNPQFIVYIDGKIRQALDTNHRFVILEGKNSYDVLLYGYAGPENSNVRLFANVSIEDKDIKKLYYDILIPYQVTEYLKQDTFEYQRILTYLENAAKKLWLLEVPSEKFSESVKDADDYLMKEFYSKFCGKRDMRTIGIGHTHIDVAWLWSIDQTREKAQRSFSTVIELMKRYPEYKFMSSQAVLYKMVKEECPELYEEIKKMVKAGRWEVEGAMWLEADCNLSSGESLVRQVLYGKNFFRDEFGVESHVLWLPDVFGYAAALPQILRKSDVDWFVTSKISWNDTNRMPYDTFKWKGIDGTEINTYFLTAQTERRGVEPQTGATYNSMTTPAEVCGAWHRYQQKNISNESIITFGYGDGGGGPTEHNLECLRRSEYGIPGCPDTRIDFAGDFLGRVADNMNKNPSLVPEWQGELYLEFHRGTYTSQARNKRNNRKSEFTLLDVENLYTALDKFGLAKFPKEKLHSAWETVLTNQFHDIIPGSSIPEVYERTDREYKEILDFTEKYRNSAYDLIASNISGDGYVVFNPHSFKNSSIVNIEGKSVYVENVPPKGYKVIKDVSCTNDIKISGKTVFTKFFTVKFDKDYNITSIFDKKNHREIVKKNERANQFLILQDYPDEYDAWELQRSASDKVYKVNSVEDVKVIEDGARTGISLVRKHLKSTIYQTIWFYANMPKIDFETKVDWHAKKQALKVSFPVDINTDRATYDIQFGSIERPTHYNTSWDQAKFEVCAHKYADLSEGNYGISLMNDCKYGHDIHNSDMRLTLLKSAINPDGNREHINDQGIHYMTYSLYPHAKSVTESKAVEYSYDLNLPMSARKVSGKGNLPSEFSLVSVNCDNVIVETVKQAEYSSDTIVRMYDAKNTHSRVTVNFGFDVKEAFIANLSEKPIKQLKVKDNSVSFDVKPFEIITLLLK